jgi:outer membrane protein assembly factor BamB
MRPKQPRKSTVWMPARVKCFGLRRKKEEIWSSTLVADGKVYIGTRRGLVVFLPAATHNIWPISSPSSAVWSIPSAANGVLYVASQRNL